MLEISELEPLIIEWAKEKNINNPNNQYLKILEEVGETARAILKNDIPEIKDGIGDIAVTVIIYYSIDKESINLDYIKDKEFNNQLCFESLLIHINACSCTLFMPLENLATNNNTTLKECLNIAWNAIKDRQGKTLNGNFIKNQKL